MRVTTLWLLAASLSCTLPAETLARADAPASAGGFSFELIDDGGRTLPTFFHGGRTYVREPPGFGTGCGSTTSPGAGPRWW
jgi:hypothetical protein